MKVKKYITIAAALTCLVMGGFGAVAASASHVINRSCSTGCVKEFNLPPADDGPFGVSAGPDGRVWYSHGSTIGSLTSSGGVRTYSLPTTAPGVGWLTLDRKRHGVWFAERLANKIGFIKPNNRVTEYTIPTTSVANCPANQGGTTTVPHGIVLKGRYVWFTEECGDKIGRLGPGGKITEYATAAGAGPQGLALGPDGNLWFTERYANAVGKVTPSGKVTEYPLASGVAPQRIVGDKRDGDMWFTELRGDAIGRITPHGKIRLFPLPQGAMPVGITVGPRGDIWFVDFGNSAIGHMSVSGRFLKEYPLPYPNSGALQMAWGPDKALWVTQGATNSLARLKP